METPTETWQVDVDGTLYEADTETLRQWILDGYVFPETKVQKGTLKWIELKRVPAFRDLVAGSSGGYAPATPGYGSPALGASAATAVCVNHVSAPAKFVCQGCGASVCAACVRRYGGSTAVCSLCGQLCQPIVAAQEQAKRAGEISAGYGFQDFALAMQYPFKDPIALALTSVVYGVLCLLGLYGKLIAAAILFGYMSHAIRRVSMGYYDEGPSPDLSDPSELIFDAGKLGLAISIVTYGPIVAVILFGLSSIGEFDLTTLFSLGIGMLLAVLWAVLYYPMALLVAGYTNGFFSTLNPIVGIATVGRLGLDYVKAYLMCLVVYIIQAVIVSLLGGIGPALESATSAGVSAIGYLVQYIIQGSVWFFASMVVAALLGLVLYKRPDVVDLEA